MDLRGLAQQVKASYSELEGSKFKSYWAFSQALETNVITRFPLSPRVKIDNDEND